MTLTSPNCPSAELLPWQVKEYVSQLKDVADVFVQITFTPPWDKDKMSEEAQLELGLL